MKKGFTLIELLAVIVILAIIVLISTPMILGVIEKAKKGGAESSALGYIDAIEYKISLDSTNNLGNVLNDGTYDVNDIEVQVKGSKPMSGTFEVKSGNVVNAIMCINGYEVIYENSKASATKSSKCGLNNEENNQKDYYTDSNIIDSFIYKYSNSNNTDDLLKNLSGDYDATLTETISNDYGLYFNGTNSYAKIKEFNYQNFTVEVSFRLEEYKNDISTIIANYEQGGFGIYLEKNKIICEAYIDNNYRTVEFEGIELYKIYTASITINNGLLIMYVNGEEIGKYAGENIKYPNYNTILMLGVNPNGSTASSEYFKGYLLSARGYSSVLTKEQIKNNYEVDLNNFKRPDIELNRDLLFEYNYNNKNNTNTTLKDESPNNIDGMMNQVKISDNGLLFSGDYTKSYVKIPHQELSKLTFTATFRIFGDTDNGVQSIISNTEQGGCDIIYDKTTKKIVSECYSGDYVKLYSKENIEFNKVYTASVIFSSGNYQFYLNGELQDYSSNYYNYIDSKNNASFSLGAEPGSNNSIDDSNYLYGAIYYASVYKRPLNQKEILKIHTDLQNKYSSKTGNLRDIPLLVAYNYKNVNDNKLIDLTGHGYDGIIGGATITDKGLYFNGIDNYVKSINLSLKKYTYVVKFSLDEKNTKNDSSIFADYQGGGNGLTLDSNNAVSAMAYIGGNYRTITSQVLELNHLYTAIITYDGSTLKFYLDNELIGKYESTSGLVNSNRPMYLGTEAAYDGSPEAGTNFKGYIQLFKAYNYSFTEEEMKLINIVD